MNTISSEKSLIRWEQNINGSNITAVDQLFLKDDYFGLFKRLAEYTLKDGPKLDFMNIWHPICADSCIELIRKLSGVCSEPENIAKVVNKFRGNVGEILAEKVFELFGTNWDIKPGSYKTVDPQNEMFIDAQAVHIADGLPLGIQVKNYSEHSRSHRNPVKWETFIKSMAMNSFWCADTKIVKPVETVQFYSCPRQYIFSFTPPDFDKLLQDYKGSVRFIGPNDIKKLDLQNKSYVFSQILDEISLLS